MTQTHWSEDCSIVQTGHLWPAEVTFQRLDFWSVASNLNIELARLSLQLAKEIGMRRNEAGSFMMTRSHIDVKVTNYNKQIPRVLELVDINELQKY
jgi:hypothetical protein